jgi:hypothetical protein
MVTKEASEGRTVEGRANLEEVEMVFGGQGEGWGYHPCRL